MYSNPEQFAQATKALFDSQLAAFNAMTSTAVEGIEKVVALNIAAVKSSTKESLAAAKELSATTDPQAFLATGAAQAKANAEKAAAYGREFKEIATGLKSDFTKAAEEQLSQAKSKVSALVEDVSKNAPAGSENAVAMFKSAINNANAGIEQITKVSKQAVETVEAQVAKANEQITQAIEQTIAQVTKK